MFVKMHQVSKFRIEYKLLFVLSFNQEEMGRGPFLNYFAYFVCVMYVDTQSIHHCM